MPGTHGDLFHEIGQLVVAANAGEPLDLSATSEELSRRYANLGVPADMMARAIARSLGAVGVSMALVKTWDHRPIEDMLGLKPDIEIDRHAFHSDEEEDDGPTKPTSSLFPSGVRLALIS